MGEEKSGSIDSIVVLPIAIFPGVGGGKGENRALTYSYW